MMQGYQSCHCVLAWEHLYTITLIYRQALKNFFSNRKASFREVETDRRTMLCASLIIVLILGMKDDTTDPA